MSNTVRTTFSLDFIRNNAKAFGSFPQSQESLTTYSDKIHQTTQLVGTTHELLSVGDVPDDALLVLQNLHATAEVSLGIVVSATYYPVIVVPAGETAKIPRLEAVGSTYLKASAASTPVLVALYEIDPTA